MGKGSRVRRQNGNKISSSLAPGNGKDQQKIFQSTKEEEENDDQISQPCKRCEDEISNLRQLNERLSKYINTSRLEEHRKLAEMESQIHIHQVAATNFKSEMDSMASERELLNLKNRELSSEAEFLKAQLNEYNDRLVEMEGERVQNERVLQQCRTESIDLQSDLNDSKERIQDLVKKIEDDTHLWNAEKNNLQGTVAELQTKHELMGREMGSLTQNNRALSIEVEFFKWQGNALESELNDAKKRTQELEDYRHLWDMKKNNLEGILASLQTKHDLLVKERRSLTQKNRSLSIEVEFLKYQVNEGVKQHSGEVQRQLLVMAEEKKSQLASLQDQLSSISAAKKFLEEENKSLKTELERRTLASEDIQKQLLVMAEEKKSQLASLEDELSSVSAAKKFLEEENKSLQTELDRRTLISEEEKSDLQRQLLVMAEEKKRQLASLQDKLSSLSQKNKSLQTELDRRTLASEEEKVRLEGRVRELKTTFNSLNKELESSRAIAEEIVNRHTDLAETKHSLKEGNDFLVTELNRCTTVSEENVRLQNRIRELETAHDFVNNETESKADRQPQPVQSKPLVNRIENGNGKPKPIGVPVETSENEKPKCVDEKGKPKPNGMTENPTQKQVPKKPTRNPLHEKPQNF